MYTSQTKPAYHESAKAAKILLDTIYDITDGNVKKALETAIETLFLDAMDDWHKSDTKLSAIDYLGLTEKDYAYWLLGEDRNIDIILNRKIIKQNANEYRLKKKYLKETNLEFDK